jgi:PIN domain nuclease of toxin-antitoxin system
MSAVLVDTHILLWMRTRPEELTPGELQTIGAAQVRYVSAVSLWELAILIGLGRVEADQRLLDVPEGYELLSVSPAHCRTVAKLPRHHRDPFDRMLVCQALAHGLTLLTPDPLISRYPVRTAW